MDQERFDEFARGLVSGITRRGMVRNLTGAALGGILAARGASESEARKKKGGKRKKRRQACTPKTCAELGRTCGTAPDDGCGNPLDCGPESVCGDETSTNCCGGKCCKANGVLCGSNSECCNGDCRGIGFLKTCWAFTDYVCAP